MNKKPVTMSGLRPAPMAFEQVAPAFDARFGAWQSVAAQRRAVRAALLKAFPPRGRILEIGGGTGDDAAFLAAHGLNLLVTDASPAMVALARKKLARFSQRAEVVAGEELDEFSRRHLAAGHLMFDGAFSNFAPLNCIADMTPVAHGLARLLRSGAPALLVLFGTSCPGEVVTEILRGRVHQALRRFGRRETAAHIAQSNFSIVYHRGKALQRVLAPWFVLEKRLGIGITVPPSAAEPWISRHPRLLTAMETIDRAASRPFATLGDHVLYQFRRTSVEC